MWRHLTPCDTMWHPVVLCDTMWCHLMRLTSIELYDILWNPMWCHTCITPCGVFRHHVLSLNTIWHHDNNNQPDSLMIYGLLVHVLMPHEVILGHLTTRYWIYQCDTNVRCLICCACWMSFYIWCTTRNIIFSWSFNIVQSDLTLD